MGGSYKSEFTKKTFRSAYSKAKEVKNSSNLKQKKNGRVFIPEIKVRQIRVIFKLL